MSGRINKHATRLRDLLLKIEYSAHRTAETELLALKTHLVGKALRVYVLTRTDRSSNLSRFLCYQIGTVSRQASFQAVEPTTASLTVTLDAVNFCVTKYSIYIVRALGAALKTP